ncbi:MAG: 2Fe-2S iron-sulfur cluster-binding protein [Myxococcota bacterium]
MARITFRSPLQELTVEVAAGTTILEAAETAGAQVGHSCGGACACSTCHVWVKKGLDSLSEQDDMELDRLDLAYDVKPQSRLACQAKVSEGDVDVWITEESLKAFMDENPDVRRALEAAGQWPPKKFA